MTKEKTKLSMPVFPRLMNYVKMDKKTLTLAMVLLIIATGADVLGPIITKIFIDSYLMRRRFPLEPVLLLAGAFIFSYLISAWFHYIQMVLFQKIALNIVQKMRVQVFSKVQQLGLAFFDRTPGGSLVSRITNDTEAIKDLFVSVLSTFVSSGVMMIGIFVGMFFLDIRLAAICLVLMPFILGLMWGYGRLSSAIYRVSRMKLSQLNAKLNESLLGMSMIQAMRQEKRLRDEFGKINEEHWITRLKSVRLNAWMLRSAVYSVYLIGLIFVLLFFGIQSLDRAVSIGILYAFVNYLDRFFDPVNQMMQQLTIYQEAMVSAERVFRLLDEKRTAPAQKGHSPVRIQRGEVEFRDVSFSYDGKVDVLKHISFTAHAGETIAFVGHTGSGKSSIINLLMRFYPFTRGKILIDGQPLAAYSEQELRSKLGLVLQDSFLFSGDVADNIRLSREAGDRSVREAARFVQADPFIMQLAGKYHERIGGSGTALSTGQKQLISFARTMILNPQILVLDEATANIDTETEELIQKALAKMRQGRTTIAIAHRLSTIQEADQILVLRQGEIVERGNHQSLLKHKGLYYNMYRLQHGRNEAAVRGTS